ncbi:MAG: SGNH/GDSL hydrolase family protein [Bacteroidota bacterium]
MNRRHFLRNATLSGALLSLSPQLAACQDQETPPEEAGSVILFQGDSITDAHRLKERTFPNRSAALGTGYAGMAAAMLLESDPEAEYQVYNRGISGNKVFQLAERWQQDCLDLKPNVLSILIGVNDFWHTLTHDYQGTIETYEKDFRALLDRSMKALPDVKLIIGEPFVIKGGRAIENKDWFPAFIAYQEAAQRIAKDYDAAWIPYQSLFDQALQKGGVSHWCPDGVHPSPAGNLLMAKAWVKAFSQAMD